MVAAVNRLFARRPAPPAGDPASTGGPARPWTAQVGVGQLPCRGEVACGDRAIVQHFDQVLQVAVVDVAGHGRRAAQLGEALDAHLRTLGDLPVTAWLHAAHLHLCGSQGAVAAVLRLDLARGIGEIAAVGNVRCGWFGRQSKHHEPYAGLLGVAMPRVQAAPLRWSGTQLFALASDGIRSEGWTALQRDWPTLDCETLARRTTRLYQRRHDDATTVCVRVVQAPPEEPRGEPDAGG